MGCDVQTRRPCRRAGPAGRLVSIERARKNRAHFLSMLGLAAAMIWLHELAQMSTAPSMALLSVTDTATPMVSSAMINHNHRRNQAPPICIDGVQDPIPPHPPGGWLALFASTLPPRVRTAQARGFLWRAKKVPPAVKLGASERSLGDRKPRCLFHCHLAFRPELNAAAANP